MCLTGFTGSLCESCTANHYGEFCDTCPGVGPKATPDYQNVCTLRGVCADGRLGAGSCTCNAPFTGNQCEYGECDAGKASGKLPMDCSGCGRHHLWHAVTD